MTYRNHLLFRTGDMALGAALAIIGAVLLLDRLNILAVNIENPLFHGLLRLWPVVLIVAGLFWLLAAKRQEVECGVSSSVQTTTEGEHEQ